MKPPRHSFYRYFTYHKNWKKRLAILCVPRRLICLFLWSTLFLAACSSLTGQKQPTLIPTEYVPTAIALTVEAGQAASILPSESLPFTASPTQPPSPTALFISNTPTRQVVETPTQPSQPTVTASPPQTASPTITRTVVKTNLPSRPTATPSRPIATVEATPSPQPSPTKTPTSRYYRTRTPTATPGIPKATILLYSPGPMSKLTSPIQLSASLQPGAGGQVTIELLGEDGRLLYRKLIRYITQDWVGILEEVEFNIAAAAEIARLQISTKDEKGRLVTLASVNLILLSMGDDDLNQPADLLEPLIIREPLPNILIQGGKVVVTGLVRTGGEKPLLVEIMDAKGKVVGYRQAVVTLPVDRWATNGYATFKAEVPYRVDGPTWVRVVVSAFEDRLPGPTHLSSVVILLGP